MPAETRDDSAASQLRRAFAGLVAVERLSRAFEALAIGASGAWVLNGLARLESAAAAREAFVPCLIAGALAAASWFVERWRDRCEIAARADRVLATPQLLDTALGAPQTALTGWGELLARRALSRFDRTRLWLAAAPAWASTAALVLLAAGGRELLVHWAPGEFAPAPLAGEWKALAEGLEAGTQPAVTQASAARAELAAELRLAAALESRGELGAAEARALLERAAERLSEPTSAQVPAAAGRPSASAALAELAKAYGRPPGGSGAAAGAGIAGTPSSGAGSGVPSRAGDGTMGGSTETGPVRPPAPPGSAGSGAEGGLRPTLSARWWPRDQDGLVEAWIARQQRTRSKR